MARKSGTYAHFSYPVSSPTESSGCNHLCLRRGGCLFSVQERQVSCAARVRVKGRLDRACCRAAYYLDFLSSFLSSSFSLLVVSKRGFEEVISPLYDPSIFISSGDSIPSETLESSLEIQSCSIGMGSAGTSSWEDSSSFAESSSPDLSLPSLSECPSVLASVLGMYLPKV